MEKVIKVCEIKEKGELEIKRWCKIEGEMKKIKSTDWGEDFGGLLDGGNAGPLPLLEELHPGGVVKGGRRVRAEEGGKALAIWQGWRAGAIGQLGNIREKKRKIGGKQWLKQEGIKDIEV